MTRSRASSTEAAAILRKALAGGRLRRLPRHPHRRDVLLALFSLRMRRRYPYSEPEINRLLKSALANFDTDVDHVTCRRFMVDLGFVRRDRAGNRYFLNYPKVETVLADELIESADDPIEQLLARI